jgi:2-phospho-L-lactate guanylyltransferase
MALWAIVPVKALSHGKSRLASFLSLQERQELNIHLLAHTLETLRAVSEIEQVLVISRDQKALAMARDYQARTIQENGDSQLNNALTLATMVAKSYVTRGIMVVPADLPLMKPEDVRAVIAKANKPPVVAIAPDRYKRGTNILLVCPAGIIEYNFGVDSYAQHCASALKAGARLEVVDLPSLALDIDLPKDLTLASAMLSQDVDSIK